MTRPDLLFQHAGALLFLEMVRTSRELRNPAGSSNHFSSSCLFDKVKIASQGAITWPFTCEAKVWRQWSCVADTIVAAPASLFGVFRQQCIGKISCYPEARGVSTALARESKTVPADAGKKGGAGTKNAPMKKKKKKHLQDHLPGLGEDEEESENEKGGGNDEPRRYEIIPWSRRSLFVQSQRTAQKRILAVSDPKLRTSPDHFDKLSMEGHEDFNKPHGPVWHSGHGCVLVQNCLKLYHYSLCC